MQHPHQHIAGFWERAPFFRLLLPLAAGIYFYDLFGYGGLSVSQYCLSVGICFLSFCIIVCRKIISTTGIHISFILANFILFSSGTIISGLNDIRQDSKWFGHHIETFSKYVARVEAEPTEKALAWQLRVCMICSIKDNDIKPVTGDAIVDIQKSDVPMNLHKGDTVLLRAKWESVKNAGNPYEYDYALYCRRNNIIYNQFCMPEDVRLFAKYNLATISLIEKTHNWCMKQIDTFIADKDTKGLIQAMLLGDAVNLDRDLQQSYSDTGIVHMIAISGCQVAFLFMAVSFLFRWLKNRKYLWIKYVATLPLIWLYVVMAGAEPSAIRAAIMFSLLALGIILDREHSSLNTLFATSFILLCANPSSLFSLGFQLSFVAVLSVILFFKPIYRLFKPKTKITVWLCKIFVGSIAAEILVAPLVIWYFHMFPILFIVSNLLAFLLMNTALLMAMGIVFLAWATPVAKGIGLFITGLVTWFNKVIFWLQEFNPRSFSYLKFSGFELLLVYVIIVSMAIFFMIRYKQALFISLTTLCFLVMLSCVNEWTRLHREEFVVFNTGKTNHIELVQGAYYSVLNSDSLSIAKVEDIVKPAHTYWQAWENKQFSKTEIIKIGGKTVLMLNEEIKTMAQFPVDYLIVNYDSRKMQPEKLEHIFSPQKIIIGNNFTQHRQEQWKQVCREAHIPVHTVKDDGAFVVNGVEKLF